jgi:hypothetical protein
MNTSVDAVYTGYPKSPDHLRNLNISTISLDFINNFFFKL